MILNTDIHAALGAAGGIDLEMIESAIDARVRETQSLDWKAVLHDGQQEFAKDIAALANARGGLLVIGVSERRGEPSAILPIEFTDATERKLRGWLANQIQPPVLDVVFEFIRRTPNDPTGVLLISVPASPDMPHMVGDGKHCSWPRRSGSRTDWMDEHDVERAYRDRFGRRVADEEALATLLAHVAEVLDPSRGPWLTLVGRPTSPTPSGVLLADRESAETALRAALATSNTIRPVAQQLTSSFIKVVCEGGINARVGLRRWVFPTKTQQPTARSEYGHIELLKDGSVMLSAPCGQFGKQSDGHTPLPDWLLTAATVDFVSLVDSVQEMRGQVSNYVVRIDLVHPNPKPLMLVSQYAGAVGLVARESRLQWTHDVRRFVPIESEFPGFRSDDDRKAAAYSLASDIVAQFGCEPSEFGWPHPTA